MGTALGIMCILSGVVLGVLGIAFAGYGAYTLSVGSRGGWWMVETLHVLMGATFLFLAHMSVRFGIELLREVRSDGNDK